MEDKKKCIFISAGDIEEFASFAIQELISEYDIFINFYGKESRKLDFLKSKATYVFNEKSTKFISLKKHYNDFIKDKYKWVAVFDDDARFIRGCLNDLIVAGERYDLNIVSGSQTGKVSYPEFRTKEKYKIRFFNFIEMNFPVFKNSALKKYMDVYDSSLCGWGNDWWYCNIIGSEDSFDMGIVDSVVIHNPEYSKIESFMSSKDREQQWESTKQKYGLKRWKLSQLFV